MKLDRRRVRRTPRHDRRVATLTWFRANHPCASPTKANRRRAKTPEFAVKQEVRPLSPQELGAVARRTVKTKAKAVGDRLKAKLVKCFFGAANLDAEQSESFVNALLSPPKPGAALKRAFKKYRALV